MDAGRRFSYFTAVACAFALGVVPAPAAAADTNFAELGLLPEAVRSDLSVGERIDAASAIAVPGTSGTSRISVVLEGDGAPVITSVEAKPGQAEELSDLLSAQPSVVVAEPDAVARITALIDDSNDEYRMAQWGLDRLQAEETRAAYVAAGRTWSQVPVVAVLDTGVQGNHPDLVGRTVGGYDFVAGVSRPADASIDPEGHGTHVAGIVGATVNNAIGVAGLLAGARIMPVRVLDENGLGYSSDIAAGIIWAADQGAGVINLSLGMGSPTASMQAAVDYAHAKGVVVVAAAGNDGEYGNAVSYPCAYSVVICVGATAETDDRACFSTFGPQVDLVAPGDEIGSTYLGSRYVYASGTSMASPFAAAAAALVRGRYPAESPAAVRTRLVNSAQDLGPAGRDDAFGAGLINPMAAAGLGSGGPAPTVSSVPPAPCGLDMAFRAAGTGILHFAAPPSSPSLSGYRLQVGTATPRTLPATTTSVRLTGLTPRASYTVSLTALSAAGSSPAATLDIVVPEALRPTIAVKVPAKTTAGSTARVTAVLTATGPTTSQRLARVPVDVYAGSSSSSLSLRSTVLTDSNGVAQYYFKSSRTTVVQFRYRGRIYTSASLPVYAANSAAAMVKVAPRLVVTRTATSRTLTMKATLKPVLSRQQLTLQRYAGGKWSNVRTVTTGSTGSAKVSLRLARGTTYKYRFVYAGNSRYNKSVSSVASVRLR